MGTRADFYAGRDGKAEWLGSVAWDGYRSGIPESLLSAKSEDDFRAQVAAFLRERDDATKPDQGWPWPWNDSGTTDCSYWFFDNQVWDEHGGRYWACSVDLPDDGTYDAELLRRVKIAFPDMSRRKSVTFGARSGLIIIGGA